MNGKPALGLTAAILALGAISLTRTSHTVAAAANKPSAAPQTWDRQAAENYLDGREVWWQAWDRSHKDHGTYCISCHTQAPYALAQPVLRGALGAAEPTAAEQAMLASIEKRVHLWSEVKPFYLDSIYGKGKEIESRNAESVLNAVMLASYDTRAGRLTDTTRLAFDHAWALQSKDGPAAGAWVWQNFHYTPWESPESEYHGAAMMAMAVGSAPGGYRGDKKIAAHLDALRNYLKSHYDAQPLLNQVVALWASASLPGLLTDAQSARLAAELKKRQRDDGGWSLTDLGAWHRVDDTPLETRSDGYATGIVVLALEENRAKLAAGDAAAGNASIARGLAWLEANQDKSTGAWPAWSLNKQRDPKSPAGPFMSDAATGYAVLALETANRPGGHIPGSQKAGQ